MEHRAFFGSSWGEKVITSIFFFKKIIIILTTFLAV
jgi:hypothetical protein